MLKDFFIWIYELFVGRLVTPEFREKIFQEVGIEMLLGAMIAAVLYYYIMNQFWSRLNKRIHYYGLMVITALCTGVLSFYDMKDDLEFPPLKDPLTMGDIYSVCFITVVLSMLFFFIFSVAIKWWSR